MGISISFRSVPLVSQDLSVAGKQKGLTGERSGLYVEAIRIIREILEATNGQYPRFCLFENVPGLLSSNKGEDFITAMDMLQELRFIPDPNIIDAQYHGVPQRRKRVYIVWTNVDYLLSKRTPTSEIITLQLLTELLQSNLADLLRASENAPKELASLPRKLTADGVRKRIRLFSLHQEGLSQSSRKYVLRRLMPTECLLLQGFPKWWVDGADGSDSAIYRAAGNSLAVPCAVDILGRIARFVEEERHGN